MNERKNIIESIAYSGAGLIAVGLSLIAMGVIADALRVRVDLTEEKLYTLSEGTKRILSQIETPIEIHYYFSRSNPQVPTTLKNFAKRVEDLLAEYKRIAGSKLIIKKFDPRPDTDAEDAARLDGIEPQTISTPGVINLRERIYCGLAVVSLDQKSSIPFLDPSREQLLEYDITRAISRVIHPQKPIIGIMSSLPIWGEVNPFAQGQAEPWFLVQELQLDYEVKRIEPTVDHIDEEIPVLLVIHPANLSDETLYAIDQFVLRGGKLIAFLDPLSLVQARTAPNMTAALQQPTSSTLGKLLEAWGLQFDTSKVVADPAFRTTINRGGQLVQETTWLSLVGTAINSDDVATAGLDQLLVVAAGAFTGTPTSGLEKTVLLKSSESGGFVDRITAQFGSDINQSFQPEGKELALAVRLVGRFKTAFPNGKPQAKASDDKKERQDVDANFLKESVKDSVVVLVGDSDMLFDAFCVRVQRFLGQRLVAPMNGNLAFCQNLIEQMLGDTGLIRIRTKAIKSRPFTVVQRMQQVAVQRYQDTIRRLEQEVRETQRRLNELQSRKDESQRFILSPEQQEELRRLQAKEAEANRELRRVRKELVREVDALQSRLKWLNVLTSPLLVTLAGLLVAWKRRQQLLKGKPALEITTEKF